MPIICDNCGFVEHSDSFHLHRKTCNQCDKRTSKKKNTIVEIGYNGAAYAFLNMPKEEAIKRYCHIEKISQEEFDLNKNVHIREFDFDDVFGSYSVWAIDN